MSAGHLIRPIPMQPDGCRSPAVQGCYHHWQGEILLLDRRLSVGANARNNYADLR
jgi:hypothetical protein